MMLTCKLKIKLFVASTLGIVFSFSQPFLASAGTLNLPEGIRCEGNFQGRSGRGICVIQAYEPGEPYDYYEGDIRNGVPHGRGVLVTAEDDRYEGEMRNGVPDGQGVFILANGNRYQGGLKNGAFHGQGLLVFNGEQ